MITENSIVGTRLDRPRVLSGDLCSLWGIYLVEMFLLMLLGAREIVNFASWMNHACSYGLINVWHSLRLKISSSAIWVFQYMLYACGSSHLTL